MQKNVIILNLDQLRADAVSHLGNKYQTTPNLDGLLEREEAVSFRNAYVQNTVSTPSRASFLTGWYPHTTGNRTMRSMVHPEKGEKTLLHYFKDAGYYIWWGGKNDVVPGDYDFEQLCDCKVSQNNVSQNHHQDLNKKEVEGDPHHYSFYIGELKPKKGFKHYDDSDWHNVEEGLQFIKNHQQKTRNKPFVMFFALTFPHPPYGVEKPFYGTFDRETNLWPRINGDIKEKPKMLQLLQKAQAISFDEAGWNELRLTYLEQVRRADYQLGLVISELKNQGIYEDSAIFIFSDHGDYTGDWGIAEKTQNTFDDCLVRVPFVYKPPVEVSFSPGIHNGMIELVDFFGTAINLTELSPDNVHYHFGLDLHRYINDPNAQIRDSVITVGGRLPDEIHASEKESRSYTNFKSPYYPRIKIQVDNPQAHAKSIMLRDQNYKFVYRISGENELFDLKHDSGETNNLYHDPKFQNLINKYYKLMLKRLFLTSDIVSKKLDSR